MKNVKGCVRLIEDMVTEIQAAAQNGVQNVNTELKNLREQLAVRQLTGSAIPSQVLSAMGWRCRKYYPIHLRVRKSAGNHYMGNDRVSNCTSSMCCNATSQP